MKKMLLLLVALCATMTVFAAFKPAFYVKKGDDIMKFNFGVASDLRFSEDGKTLTVTGYSEVIKLDEIDYITFEAPVSDMALTPADQKEKMIQIGEAVNKLVDMNNVEELLKYMHVFTSYSTDVNGVRHTAPSEYEWPREFWDIKTTTGTVEALAKVFTGNLASIHTLASRSVDSYKARDFKGIWFADEDGGIDDRYGYTIDVWTKKGDADYLELQFLAQDRKTMYSARLEYSADAMTWTTDDFVFEAPKTMTLTLRSGDKVLATAKIEMTLVQDKSIAMDIHVEGGKYAADAKISILDDAINAYTTATVDGNYLMEVNTKIDGSGLLTYQDMKPAIKDCFESFDPVTDSWINEDPADLLAHLYRAHTTGDVLKQLQFDGRAYDFTKMWEVFSEEEDDKKEQPDADGYSFYWSRKFLNWNPTTKVLSMGYNSDSIVEKQVDYLSNYSDIQFFYDGKKTLQGFLNWELGEDCWEYAPYYDPNAEPTLGYTVVGEKCVEVSRNYSTREWEYSMRNPDAEDEKDYYKTVTVPADQVMVPELERTIKYIPQPLLAFPDLTTYAFGDYFTRASFQQLIGDYNDIIRVYKKICNIKDDEDYD